MPQTALPNLGVNYNYDVGADGWGAGLDFDLVALDALTMPRVQDKDLSAPPASPTQGLAWIVAASPTGAWTGKAGQIAVASSAAVGGWFFFVPKSGWTTYVVDESLEYEHTGSAWQVKSSTFGNTLIKSADAAAARAALGAAPAFGNQSANQVYAGPTTGGAAAPLFRALVAADIPSIPIAKISDAGSMASQDSNAVSISGGAINSTPVGAGGASTGAFTTLTVSGGAQLNSNVAIGTIVNATVGLRVSKTVTGGAVAYNALLDGVVQSDVTTRAFGVQSRLNTAAASFTLPQFVHYSATRTGIGAGSVVSAQFGFQADSSMTGATVNYGFYGDLPAGAGWNAYMNGAAPNHFNGAVLVGTTSDNAIDKLQVSGSVGVLADFINIYGANPTVSSRTSGSRLLLTGASAGNAIGGGAIALRDTASATNPHGLEFFAGGNEAARITSARNLLVGPTTDNTFAKVQSSNGITLGNAASAHATVLDWQEKGQFTPVAVGTTSAGAGTYTVQSGRFTRTANRCKGQANVTITAHTGTGNLRISGLPFASANVANSFSACAVFAANLVIGAGKQLVALIPPNSTQIILYALDVAGGATSPLAMDTAFELTINFDYEV